MKSRSELPPLRWLGNLADAAPRLPLHRPRLYYSQRARDDADASNSVLPAIARRARGLINELAEDCYFDQVLEVQCIEFSLPPGPTPEEILNSSVGKPHLWSDEFEEWAEADLCDFIEVFHDQAARPIRRWFHTFADTVCGWHVESFSKRSGQAIYRWRMNQLLDSTPFEFRLAETGEDTGRMVRRIPSDLGRLVDEVLGDAAAGDPEAHAIFLFRQRDATREDRRSAVVALAGVLEERRELLKEQLLKKDERALFEIANKFALRHRKANQRGDYDDAYLEWIFYWYLATVHLTRQLSGDTPDTPQGTLP
ncbi:MAG: hypothetical protein KTV68_09665 [Acidimicrobiia bacterium]|nr:hypothetical protein [Acidimicrobiia bacterium]MCY4434560.1 hypothetical protein [bacterium]